MYHVVVNTYYIPFNAYLPAGNAWLRYTAVLDASIGKVQAVPRRRKATCFAHWRELQSRIKNTKTGDYPFWCSVAPQRGPKPPVYRLGVWRTISCGVYFVTSHIISLQTVSSGFWSNCLKIPQMPPFYGVLSKSN